MIILVYFIISIVVGVVPAYLARRMQRNLVLWYLYSIFFLPIACIHLVVLKFKLKLLMVFVYILLIVYFLVGFYYIEWYVITQPQAKAEVVFVKGKYNIATLMLDNPGIISEVPAAEINTFFAEKTGLQVAEIEKILIKFKPNSRGDTNYLKEFSIDLLISLYDHYKFVEEQGEFSDNSVPMGFAKEIFLMYIDSLKLINKHAPELGERYPADNEAKQESLQRLIEKNFMAMLKTEASFFKTTDNSVAFLANLEEQLPIAGTKERLVELSDYYEEIGDIFLVNQEFPQAVSSYEKSVDMKKRVIHEYEETQRDNTDIQKEIDSFNLNILTYYIDISDIYEKISAAAGIISAFENFLVIYFESGIYLVEKEFYKLESFIKLKTIIRDKAYRTTAIETFLTATQKYKDLNKTVISSLEVKYFTSIYFSLTKEERGLYAPVVQNAYVHLVAAKDVYVTELVEQAYNFFKEYKQEQIKLAFADILEEIEPKLDEFEDSIVNELYPVFEKEIQAALLITEQYMVEQQGLDAEKKEVLKNLNIKVRDLYDDITDEVTLVIRGKKRIETILMKAVPLERINLIDDNIRHDRNTFIILWQALRSEDTILNEEYGKLLKTCEDLKKLAKGIDSKALPANSRNKNNLESMRRAVKNSNLRIESDIKHIKEVKKEVGKKYDTEITSTELEEALAELMRQEEIADVDFRKVFTEGLPKDKRADLE